MQGAAAGDGQQPVHSTVSPPFASLHQPAKMAVLRRKARQHPCSSDLQVFLG